MRKSQLWVRVSSLFLALLFLVPLMMACGEEPLEENQIAVEWHMGMVTSDRHADSPLTILENEEGYSYSEVMIIPKRGTKITFVDDNSADALDTQYATEEVFVLSHWIEQDGEWVIDHPGDNYTGIDGRSGEIAVWRTEQTEYTYITSYDNEAIRICYRSGQTKKNTKKLEFAKVYAEETDQKGTFLSADEKIHKDLAVAKFLATAKETCWFEELEDITLYAMGDSYFGGSKNGKEYVWPNLMAQKYGMEFSNWGIGGSTVSNAPDKNSNPMCDRISKMTVGGTPDIILLEGGRNDFNQGVALGETDSGDPATFCGAVNSCIAQLKAKYPNALIIGITCWNVNQTKNNVKQQAFADAMMAVCAANGLPCFDATDETVTGVHMNQSSFREAYCQDANDISHLNTAGMILVEPAFEKFIAEQYKSFLAAK